MKYFILGLWKFDRIVTNLREEDFDFFTIDETIGSIDNINEPTTSTQIESEPIIITNPSAVSFAATTDTSKQDPTPARITRKKKPYTYQIPLRNKKAVYKKIPLTNEWKKGNFSHNKLLTQFIGETNMPQEVNYLETPKDFFSYFFDDNLCSFIIQQSELYSVEINPSKTEFKRFIGIIIMMSIVHVRLILDPTGQIT